MNKVHLKRVKTEKDILETAGLAHEIWREHYAGIISSEQIEYMLDKYQSTSAISKALADGYEYYLLRHLGTSVGYLGIQTNEPQGKLFVSKIYLYKDYRGKGYAFDTLRQLEEMCGRLKLHAIWLTVNKGNPSVKAYERIGFRIDKEQISNIGNGFVMDDFVMEKEV